MVTSGTNGLNQVAIGGTGLRILKTNGSIGSSEFAGALVGSILYPGGLRSD